MVPGAYQGGATSFKNRALFEVWLPDYYNNSFHGKPESIWCNACLALTCAVGGASAVGGGSAGGYSHGGWARGDNSMEL